MKNYIKYLPLLVIMLLVATPAMAFNLEEGITDFVNEMGFVSFFQGDGWKNLAMIAIGCVLLYLAIKKGF